MPRGIHLSFFLQRRFLLLFFLLGLYGTYRIFANDAPIRRPYSNPFSFDTLGGLRSKSSASTCNVRNPHPIDELVCDADRQFKELMQKQTHDVRSAAARYREKRGRHPPPKFDKWVKFALDNNALIIEDFFDQIYTDTDMLWGVPTSVIRGFSSSWWAIVSVRNGTARRWENEQNQLLVMTDHWRDLIQHIPNEDLPDVDMAFNIGDEPHMFVSWEKVNRAMTDGNQLKHTLLPTQQEPIYNDYSQYPPLPKNSPDKGYVWHEKQEDDLLWEQSRRACPPDSPARPLRQDNFSSPAPFPANLANQDHMYKGYVKNWTQAQNACFQPHLRNLHGSFIAMQRLEINPTLVDGFGITSVVPLFGGCKIQGINGEIAVPAAVYWKMDYESGESFTLREGFLVDWKDQYDKVMWRGSASGGHNNATNWTRFQRHRMLSMMNGTQVEATERWAANNGTLPSTVPGGDPPLLHNFPFPDPAIYGVSAFSQVPTRLGQWIASITDAFFRDLRCYPPWDWWGSDSHDCPYSGPFYEVGPTVPQSEIYKYKYQPDLDGSAMSGRYRSLLQSNTVPIKATIYGEWHDSRLIPWKHFVPMDNTFVDFWGILEYFFGYQSDDPSLAKKPHDKVAQVLGENGRVWSDQVLRDVDMVIYMYRLVLEFARISDDRRVQMGYTDDLL